jgi:hypothetical protein
MESRIGTTALFMIVAMAMVGAALWVGVADKVNTSQQGTQPGPPADAAFDNPANGRVPSDVANQPLAGSEPAASQPPVVMPAPSPPSVLNALHVLCPLPGGGSAHLLLTADAYYKAVTPAEEALLTERLGPPVTTIDPNVLPPKSAASVTDMLNGRTS